MTTLARFKEALLASPPTTPLSRYTALNGALYIVLGLTFYVSPGLLGLTGADEPPAGEEGLLRIIGFVMAVIGWFVP